MVTQIVDISQENKKQRKRCPVCIGTGVLMGGGMVSVDCPHCEDGYNSANVENNGLNCQKSAEKPVILIDKRKKEYKAAFNSMKEKLKANGHKKTDAEIHAMIAEEMNK